MLVNPIPSDHLEQLSSTFSALTIDPYKNTVYYFFPFIGAFFNNYLALSKTDPSLEAMMPQGPTGQILDEIQNLTDCARIQRKIVPYIALNHHFSSCGGSYSLTTPALFMPEPHLYRREGRSPFSQEQPAENLRANRWVFSDDETRFLISRELGQIKENSILLRIAIKVSVIAALFIIYASPFGWPVGLVLFIGVLGLYIVSERFFRARADTLGAEILGKRLNDPRRAIQIAIDTLEKQREQNLYRRENNKLARLYITDSGNNALDFLHPYLTTRIERLQLCARRS